MSAVIVALPAFVAERRAAAPLLLSAGACCSVAQQSIDRYLVPAGHPAANPQQRRANDKTGGHIKRRTNGRPTVTETPLRIGLKKVKK